MGCIWYHHRYIGQRGVRNRRLFAVLMNYIDKDSSIFEELNSDYSDDGVAACTYIREDDVGNIPLAPNESISVKGVCTDHSDPTNLGRICAVNIEAAGHSARLVSVYGPVRPASRIAFQQSLKKLSE